MKEKLVKYWTDKYNLAQKEISSNIRLTYAAQAYGALEFIILQGTLPYEEAEELCQLWDSEWHPKFYKEV